MAAVEEIKYGFNVTIPMNHSRNETLDTTIGAVTFHSPSSMNIAKYLFHDPPCQRKVLMSFGKVLKEIN